MIILRWVAKPRGHRHEWLHVTATCAHLRHSTAQLVAVGLRWSTVAESESDHHACVPPQRNIADTGLSLLLQICESFEGSDFATQFYQVYYLQLMQEIFAVMTGASSGCLRVCVESVPMRCSRHALSSIETFLTQGGHARAFAAVCYGHYRADVPIRATLFQ